MLYALTINGRQYRLDTEPGTPLLWVLRDDLQMTGTKFGCGAGLCGACSVQLDGAVARSCQVPIDQVGARRITTIEGLSPDGASHPLQRAWLAEQVPQCGYCQSGMIMAAASLLAQSPNPSAAEVDAAMTNLCRCGTYPRIRRAIARVAAGQ